MGKHLYWARAGTVAALPTGTAIAVSLLPVCEKCSRVILCVIFYFIFPLLYLRQCRPINQSTHASVELSSVPSVDMVTSLRVSLIAGVQQLPSAGSFVPKPAAEISLTDFFFLVRCCCCVADVPQAGCGTTLFLSSL